MGGSMYLEPKRAVFLDSGLLYLGRGKVAFGKKKAPGLGTPRAIQRCIKQKRHQTQMLIWLIRSDGSANEGRTCVAPLSFSLDQELPETITSESGRHLRFVSYS
jgi:hypothetical protein